MEKKRKLIIADCDGTLLSSSHTLSQEATSYIFSLKERGILFVLSSGRPPRSMLPYYEVLGLDTPLISYNGGLVYSPRQESFPMKKHAFCRDDVLKIYAKADSFLLGFQAEEGDNLYCLEEDPSLDSYFWKKGMNLIKGEPKKTLANDPYSVVFKCARQDDTKLEAIVNEFPPLRWRHWTGSLFSELYYEEANKGNGLRAIMDYYGIRKEDCYAFGDSLNDKEMLLLSGHPFVMKNSKSEELKEEFQTTRFTNDEDGVLKELVAIFA